MPQVFAKKSSVLVGEAKVGTLGVARIEQTEVGIATGAGIALPGGSGALIEAEAEQQLTEADAVQEPAFMPEILVMAVDEGAVAHHGIGYIDALEVA